MTSSVAEARRALEKALEEERQIMDETAKIYEEKAAISMAIVRASMGDREPEPGLIERMRVLDEKLMGMPRPPAIWPLKEALKEAEKVEQNAPNVP